MDRTLIKKYIDNQPQKIVTKMDLDKNKIEYQGILQGQIINEIKGDEEKFKETMEAFHQKRAEFIAQEIRSFDAETLYVFLEWIRGNGHKLDRITGMAV